MRRAPLTHLTILGGSHEGWAIALYLHRHLGPVRPDITVVEITGEDCPGALSASPAVAEWLVTLGFNPLQLAAGTGGSLKLGEQIEGASGSGEPGFLPYGPVGAPIGPVKFHQQLARLDALDPPRRYADFAAATVLARHARFALPSDDPRSIIAELEFGLHLDRQRLRAALRQAGTALGISALITRSIELAVAPQGPITGVQLDDGLHATPGLVIDTRNSAAGGTDWLGRSLGPFELEIESAIVADKDAPPTTHNRLTGQGWIRAIPLLDRTAITALMPASADPAGEIAKTLACDGEIRISPLTAGRGRTPWAGNHLRMGAAGWQVPALAGTDLSLLAKACERLLQAFPDSGPGEQEAAEYNRLMAQEIESALDFAELLLMTQARPESLWRAARQIAPSGNVARALGLFGSRGRLMLDEFSHHGDAMWVAALLAMDVRPANIDPQACALDPALLQARLDRIRTLLDRLPAQHPTHAAFLAQLRTGARA